MLTWCEVAYSQVYTYVQIRTRYRAQWDTHGMLKMQAVLLPSLWATKSASKA